MGSLDTIQGIELFEDIAESELHAIRHLVSDCQYERGDTVFLQGDERHSVFFILRGLVKVTKVDAEGREHVVNILGSGQMFPHTGFFEEEPYPGTAVALSTTQVLVMPSELFERLLMKHPVIMRRLMKVMENKIRHLQSRLREVVLFNSLERVQALLRHFVDEHGVLTPQGIHLQLPVTNTEMAHMIGLTRESVNRTLRQLKNDGVLVIGPDGWLLCRDWYEKGT